MLAWTGIGGERTDVLAHVTGLVAGLVVGGLAWILPPTLVQRRSTQLAASALAVLALILAWAAALA